MEDDADTAGQKQKKTEDYRQKGNRTSILLINPSTTGPHAKTYKYFNLTTQYCICGVLTECCKSGLTKELAQKCNSKKQHSLRCCPEPSFTIVHMADYRCWQNVVHSLSTRGQPGSMARPGWFHVQTVTWKQSHLCLKQSLQFHPQQTGQAL